MGFKETMHRKQLSTEPGKHPALSANYIFIWILSFTRLEVHQELLIYFLNFWCTLQIYRQLNVMMVAIYKSASFALYHKIHAFIKSQPIDIHFIIQLLW